MLKLTLTNKNNPGTAGFLEGRREEQTASKIPFSPVQCTGRLQNHQWIVRVTDSILLKGFSKDGREYTEDIQADIVLTSHKAQIA